MTRPVVHFQIRGKDTARLRDFYQRLFGWRMSDGPMPGLVSIEPGTGGPENGIGGSLMASDHPRVVVFVQVADIRESLAKAEALGGRRIMDPFDVPNGPTVAQAADPEGNIIGLVQQ